MHFEALGAQGVDHIGRIGTAALAGGDDPRVGRFAAALVDRPLVFHPKIFEIKIAFLGDFVKCEQQRRFLNVGVITWSPLDAGKGWIRPIPFPTNRSGGKVQVGNEIGTVALDFIKASKTIVGDRDPEKIVGNPTVVKTIGEDARNAALRHLHDFGFGEQPPFVDGDGIKRIVVRACAGGYVKVRLSLVQIVQHGGMPVEHFSGDVLRQLQELAHAVPIVIVGDVFSPIHQGRTLLAGFLAVIVRVDLFLAAIGFDHRRNQHDHVITDRLNERRLLDHEAISQFNQHFGPTGFRRMDAAGDPVNRLCRVNQRLRLFLRDLSRIAELSKHAFVAIEILDGVLIGEGKEDLVASLFGLPDLPKLRARRCLSERFVVAIDILRISQLTRSAGDSPEELQWRRD